MEYDIKNLDRERIATGLSKDEAKDRLEEGDSTDTKTVVAWEGDNLVGKAHAPAFLEEDGLPEKVDPLGADSPTLHNRRNRMDR